MIKKIIVIALLLCALGAIIWVLVDRPWSSHSSKQLGTQVCGSFLIPRAVVGTPIRISSTSSGVVFVTLEDGYTFPAASIGGMYIGQPSIFVLTNGRVTAYARAGDMSEFDLEEFCKGLPPLPTPTPNPTPEATPTQEP